MGHESAICSAAKRARGPIDSWLKLMRAPVKDDADLICHVIWEPPEQQDLMSHGKPHHLCLQGSEL